MKYLIIPILGCLMVSCNQSGGGGGSTASSSDGKTISKTISDSTLTSFTQTSGVAKYKPSFLDKIISNAYAIDGNIRCIKGDPVSFDMDIQIGADTEDLQVDTTCGADVELAIRRKMLTALDGHIMMLELAGNGDVGSKYTLDFKNNAGQGFKFDIPHPTVEEIYMDGLNEWPCKVDYVFKEATGKVQVSIGVDDLNWVFAALKVNQDTNHHFSDSRCDVTPKVMRSPDFRFKNGKIEMDESGTKNFSINGCAKYDSNGTVLDYKENGAGDGSCPDDGYESSYELWCIDDNQDGTCDSI